MTTSHLSTTPASASALLGGAVDYAGLFPPAALVMGQAVAEYAAALDGPDAWMLGRFVVPAGRLPELAKERAALNRPSSEWRLSALVAGESDADLAAIAAFNRAAERQAVVDAIECKPTHLADIDWLAEHVAPSCAAFVEIPATEDVATWMTRLAARGLGAKIRTGGVTAAAFPEASAIAAFLQAAVRAGVRVKATAGLHHAVRGAYRLTYDANAPTGFMYGYLNVLLATAALQSGGPAAVAEQVLLLADPASLTFTDDAVRWGDHEFPTALLHATRAERLAGFGSCSFREPAEELRSLVLLHP